MNVHKDVALDPSIRPVDVESIVLGAGQHVVDEMHNRSRTIAAGEVYHVVVAHGGSEEVPQENAVAATLDSAGSMDQFEFDGRGRKQAIADNEGGAVHVDIWG